MGRPARLKKEYTWAWLLWLALVLAGEIVGLPRLGWFPVLAVGLGIEVVALARSKEGDLGSEHVWAWHGGKFWRAVQSIPLGLWVAWRLFALTPGGDAVDAALGRAVGPALLSSVVAVWLPGHFYYRGKKG